MVNQQTQPAVPGERWRVTLQPIDSIEQDFGEATVTLVDFDPRTDTWTVRQEGRADPIALQAKQLIRRAD